MYLKKLNLVHFKNREEAELEFVNGVNCFTGDNGTGKTNLLDAIYYLSFSKSCFNPVDSQNIMHGESFFMIDGVFERFDKEERIYLGLKRGEKKKLKRNKKAYDRFSDHIGLLPLVLMSPSDIELIYDGSEVRRKFIDGVIAQFNSGYLSNLLQYQKAVQQRNKLLKRFSETGKTDLSSLEIWDEQMIRYGVPVYEARKEFLNSFIPVFEEFYAKIGSDREKVKIEYRSKLSELTFEKLLEESRAKDLKMTHSTSGIHKDDLAFTMNGYSLKKTGSQGQKKSFLTALKLAQFEFMKNQKELKPILLLDDIFDKLDSGRVRSLMDMVSRDQFGQVFVTDTNKLRVKELFDTFDTPLRIFEVTNSNIEHEKE